ncbi:RNA polymerase sigma factor [Jeotgalibacillus sp. R-1-5s-1]|uniref:RNA polymerase sigma factor n=1 Tax=Jeotgalibacillus sp. R-1-5s-1 TaxID=2555897 RepID=UPI00106C12CB|nr:hypothetical protein E2491_10640 [Jeotgalibacillus sp. R-1-5s-1]
MSLHYVLYHIKEGNFRVRNKKEGSFIRHHDHILFAELSAGNQDALSQLYDRYVALLWKVVYGKTKDPALTEEVIQCVFKKLWQNPKSFTYDRFLSQELIRQCMEEIEGVKVS